MHGKSITRTAELGERIVEHVIFTTLTSDFLLQMRVISQETQLTSTYMTLNIFMIRSGGIYVICLSDGDTR